MAYQAHRKTEESRSTFVRRAILGLAALATCAVVYLHVRNADAAKRQESASYYEQRIYDIDCKLITANGEVDLAKMDLDSAEKDLKIAETVLETTQANREISEAKVRIIVARRHVEDLERERRELRDRIHRIKHPE